MVEKVYYNGEFLEYDQLIISPEDRGYLFADGVYEVINFYNGKPFRMKEHFERLMRSANALEIEIPDPEELYEAAGKLPIVNDIKDAKLYIQVTRGTQPRTHLYNDNLVPNIMMFCRKLKRNPEIFYQEGVSCITVPDDRWSRCYLKTIALLPNILAKKKAQRAGAYEAIFVRDGFVMEGSSSNLFIIKDNKIIIPPLTNYILNGITRVAVIEVAVKNGYEVREESISLEALYNANEVFLSGTTTEVIPIIKIDQRIIAAGKPGEVTQKLHREYRKLL